MRPSTRTAASRLLFRRSLRMSSVAMGVLPPGLAGGTMKFAPPRHSCTARYEILCGDGAQAVGRCRETT